MDDTEIWGSLYDIRSSKLRGTYLKLSMEERAEFLGDFDNYVLKWEDRMPNASVDILVARLWEGPDLEQIERIISSYRYSRVAEELGITRRGFYLMRRNLKKRSESNPRGLYKFGRWLISNGYEFEQDLD